MTIDIFSFFQALEEYPATVLIELYQEAMNRINDMLNSLFGSQLERLTQTQRIELTKKNSETDITR